MKPFIIGQWGSSNTLLKALCKFIRLAIKDPTLEITSPEQMEDQIVEWLGKNGKHFPRCRPKDVFVLNRPCWGCAHATRVFYDSQSGVTAFPIIAIGFKTNESTTT